MKAVAYLRVSSKAQDVTMQRSAIERAASVRGDKVTKYYSEKKSAKTLARAELEQLRQDAREGLFRRLYVFRLDRLARSGIRDTFEVIEELRTCGVEVITVADGFSLDGPAAEVILAVMAWAAKMERLAINERIAAARERVEREGGRWGRPGRMTRELFEATRKLRRQGNSIRAIARSLSLPPATVGRAVQRQRTEQSTRITGDRP